MSFLDAIKDTLVHHVHPFLESQWEEQKKHPAGSLGAAVLIIDEVAKRTPAIALT